VAMLMMAVVVVGLVLMFRRNRYLGSRGER
jgi:uncharacterized iron-regulated membrane protein